MGIVKKTETLTLSLKVPRQLHDEVDQIRALAKKHGVEYDYTDALVKALKKDIDASKSDIEQLVLENKLKPENHVDK